MQAIPHTADQHVVQFYGDEDVLCRSVIRFLQSGMERGEPTIVIASAERRERFARSLGAARSKVTMLDAKETLASFMVDGRPDRERFRRVLSGVLAPLRASSGGERICAYGEMVDMLCLAGEAEAAIELEQLWNDLAAEMGLALLCAYATESFEGTNDPTYVRICAAHARVHAAVDARDHVEADVFRTLVESVQDYAIFMLDENGVVRTWNRGAQRIKGYAAEEIVGRHFSRFYPLADVTAGKCDAMLRAAARDGRVEDQGWRIRKDGTRFWASVLITALRDASGVLTGFAKVTRDLTHQREAEEQRLARLAAERSLVMLERLHDVAGALGAARTPAEIAQIVVSRGTEALGASVGVLVQPTEGDELEIVAASGMSDERVRHWRRFPVGRSTPISVAFQTRAPVWEPAADGVLERYGDLGAPGAIACLPLVLGARVLGVMGFRFEGARMFPPEERALLATMAAQTAQALERAEASARAEEANKIKDEFLAVLSHELRTPLTSIFGWASILRANRDPNTVAQGIETIHRNAQAQIRLIEELLDVSRIVSGKLKIAPGELDLVALVREAADVVGPSARNKKLTLGLDVPQSPLVVRGDRARLQQVVLNLLSNSVKFTKEGGSITLRVVARGARVQVEVADTGRGIAREFLPLVFERFRQAEEGSARQTGGLGLGLSIAKHIVELHGGTIVASSAGVGCGASFTMTLPLEESVPEVEPETGGEVIGRDRAPLAGMKIVVVEDEADAREMLVAYLGASGADVSSAANAADGLRAVKDVQPHVLVSDIGMPVEDGYSLIRRIRGLDASEGGKVPAIALTAYNQPEDRKAAIDAGFDVHVSKPADPDALVVTVAKLAGR